jgi:hypothetical protein
VEDARVCLENAHVQHSVSTTDDPFGCILEESTLAGCVFEKHNVEDTATHPIVKDSANQKTVQERKTGIVAEIQPLSATLDHGKANENFINGEENDSGNLKNQFIHIKSIVNSNHKTEIFQHFASDSTNTSLIGHINANASEKRHSETDVKFSNILYETDSPEATKNIEIEREKDDKEAFVNLLNSDPWDKDEKLDESKLLHVISCHPYYCSVKYSFEGFHGSIYPLHAFCALGASLLAIEKCYHAFPDAITKTDAWVGTCLHYACSYQAPIHVVEFLTEKNPLALMAVNQFNRLPLHM